MPTRLLAAAAETEEHARELPMAPIWFGILAMAVFIGLFLVLWSFRSIATKH